MLTFIIIAVIAVFLAISVSVSFIHKKHLRPDSDKEQHRQPAEFKSDAGSEKDLPAIHAAVKATEQKTNKTNGNEPPQPSHIPEPLRRSEPRQCVGDMCRQCRIRHYEQMLKEYSLHRSEDN